MNSSDVTDVQVSTWESFSLALRESKDRVTAEEEKTISQFEKFMTAMQGQFGQLAAENLTLRTSLIQLQTQNQELTVSHDAAINALKEQVQSLKGSVESMRNEAKETARIAQERIQALIAEKVDAVKVAIQAGDARVVAETKAGDARVAAAKLEKDTHYTAQLASLRRELEGKIREAQERKAAQVVDLRQKVQQLKVSFNAVTVERAMNAIEASLGKMT